MCDDLLIEKIFPVQMLTLPDGSTVIKYVDSTPNGIGYVDAKKVKGHARVMMKL
ncbi:MAG: hypothetical protein ABUL58_04225 [Steroidobacter sp.]